MSSHMFFRCLFGLLSVCLSVIIHMLLLLLGVEHGTQIHGLQPQPRGDTGHGRPG